LAKTPGMVFAAKGTGGVIDKFTRQLVDET
jgi:hypothetical protein